jgi:Flp pilus assembly protein TadG
MTRQRPRDLIRDTRGTVALETALLLPVLLLLMVGSWETYAYMRAVNIIDRTAAIVADTVARKSRLYDDSSASDGDNLGAYYQAALEIAQPLDLTDGGTVILSALHNDGTATTLAWQRRAPYSSDSHASKITGPVVTTKDGVPLVLQTGETVIVAEVFLTYQPFLWSRAVWADAPLQVVLYHRAVFLSRYGGIDTLQTAGES